MTSLARLSPFVLFVSMATAACGGDDPAPSAGPHDAEPEVEDEDVLPKCELAVSKGPWVVAVDGTSAKVRWESCRSGGGALTVGPEAGGASSRVDSAVSQAIVTTNNEVPFLRTGDWAGTYFMHEVALKDLTPSTCYAYTLEQDVTAKGRFCTARPAGESFTFATIGDTNPGLGDLKLLQATVYGKKPELTVHMGDIQYYSSGLESYGTWMELMRPMLRSAAFFPAIGNHEFEKPLEREEYVERFWGNPGFDGNSDHYRFQWGGVWFFALNTEIEIGEGSSQMKWFAEKLDDATRRPGYRFAVVYFHRPFVTCADVEQKDALRKLYQPLFTKAGVKIVVAGHVHGYERFEFDDVTWLTSGGGGAKLHKMDANLSRPECVDRRSSGAFWNATLITVKPGEIAGETYDAKGALRDSFTRVVP